MVGGLGLRLGVGCCKVGYMCFFWSDGFCKVRDVNVEIFGMGMGWMDGGECGLEMEERVLVLFVR